MNLNANFQKQLDQVFWDAEQWKNLSKVEPYQKIAVDPFSGEALLPYKARTVQEKPESIKLAKMDPASTIKWLGDLQSKTQADIEALEVTLKETTDPEDHIISLQALTILKLRLKKVEEEFPKLMKTYQKEGKEVSDRLKLQWKKFTTLSEGPLKQALVTNGKLLQASRRKEAGTETIQTLSQEILNARHRVDSMSSMLTPLSKRPEKRPYFFTTENVNSKEIASLLHKTHLNAISREFLRDFHLFHHVSIKNEIYYSTKERDPSKTALNLAEGADLRLKGFLGNQTAALRVEKLMTRELQTSAAIHKAHQYFVDKGFTSSKVSTPSISVDIQGDRVLISQKVIVQGVDIEREDKISDALMCKRVISLSLKELSDIMIEENPFSTLVVTDSLSSPIASAEYAEVLLHDF